MAFQHTEPLVSVEASADLSANQFLLHQINSSSQLALSGAAGSGYVLQNKPAAAGRAGNIQITGVTKVILGATVAAGAAVEANAAGKAITLAAGIKVGRLITGGVLNDVVSMIIIDN